MTETLAFALRLPAPVDRVHHALTDPAELRVWFAEHAEVSLPGTYAFWGRHTVAGAEPAQRPLLVDDTTVRFAWTIDGTETTVELALRPDGEETVLSFTQTDFPGWGVVAGGGGGAVGLTGTFWALALANLGDHLAGRPLGPLPDFTSTDLRAEYLVDAPAERIYRAMMDPAEFVTWFNAPMELEPHVGGRWAMGGFENNPNPATITELEPNRKITLDFGGSYGQSTWELEESGGKTRLTFFQSGFATDDMPWAGWMGWLSGFAELRRYVELDPWTPLWTNDGMDAVASS